MAILLALVLLGDMLVLAPDELVSYNVAAVVFSIGLLLSRLLSTDREGGVPVVLDGEEARDRDPAHLVLVETPEGKGARTGTRIGRQCRRGACNNAHRPKSSKHCRHCDACVLRFGKLCKGNRLSPYYLTHCKVCFCFF